MALFGEEGKLSEEQDGDVDIEEAKMEGLMDDILQDPSSTERPGVGGGSATASGAPSSSTSSRIAEGRRRGSSLLIRGSSGSISSGIRFVDHFIEEELGGTVVGKAGRRRSRNERGSGDGGSSRRRSSGSILNRFVFEAQQRTAFKISLGPVFYLLLLMKYGREYSDINVKMEVLVCGFCQALSNRDCSSELSTAEAKCVLLLFVMYGTRQGLRLGRV